MLPFDDDDFVLDTTQDLPIRKPQSAYVIFGKMKRDNIMRKNPGIKVTEVVKQIAKLWQSLSKEEKLRYKELARQDKERYVTELRDLTKCNKTLDKPKKPLTPYMLFVRDTRPKVVRDHPNIPALDIMKEVGRIWQVISKEELDYFKEKSRRDMERYLKEHKSFITEINDLRASSRPDKTTFKIDVVSSDAQINAERVEISNTRERRCPHRSDNISTGPINKGRMRLNAMRGEEEVKEPADIFQTKCHPQKRRKFENLDFPHYSANEVMLQGTPLKVGKQHTCHNNFSSMQQQYHTTFDTTPSTHHDDMQSPDVLNRRNPQYQSNNQSYQNFSQEYRDILKEQHPDWPAAEIMKQISNKWQEMESAQMMQHMDIQGTGDRGFKDKQLIQELEGLIPRQKKHIFGLQHIGDHGLMTRGGKAEMRDGGENYQNLIQVYYIYTKQVYSNFQGSVKQSKSNKENIPTTDSSRNLNSQEELLSRQPMDQAGQAFRQSCLQKHPLQTSRQADQDQMTSSIDDRNVMLPPGAFGGIVPTESQMNHYLLHSPQMKPLMSDRIQEQPADFHPNIQNQQASEYEFVMTSMLGGPTYDQRKNIFEDDANHDFLAGGITGKANANKQMFFHLCIALIQMQNEFLPPQTPHYPQQCSFHGQTLGASSKNHQQSLHHQQEDMSFFTLYSDNVYNRRVHQQQPQLTSQNYQQQTASGRAQPFFTASQSNVNIGFQGGDESIPIPFDHFSSIGKHPLQEEGATDSHIENPFR